MAAISNDWLGPMSEEFKKPYYRKLYETVKHEYETREVYPGSGRYFQRLRIYAIEGCEGGDPGTGSLP